MWCCVYTVLVENKDELIFQCCRSFLCLLLPFSGNQREQFPGKSSSWANGSTCIWIKSVSQLFHIYTHRESYIILFWNKGILSYTLLLFSFEQNPSNFLPYTFRIHKQRLKLFKLICRETHLVVGCLVKNVNVDYL